MGNRLRTFPIELQKILAWGGGGGGLFGSKCLCPFRRAEYIISHDKKKPQNTFLVQIGATPLKIDAETQT